ncbi:type IV pilin protein [Immundisolibacter sp.]|uniref:type IV pilin protein n=1 Tax=Immundisolibacter sp. TaxID=1934948 RepID=UPI00261EF574|nr:type IV pilin protein [Immundisolibacter sp.]MDD3652050.1 type IV pilin protein [Immundisolibacter sp.]
MTVPDNPSAARRPVRGFTLVELMIVVAIVGILTAIAYPGYRSFVLRSHRSDATTTLLRIAQNLERYYTLHNSYTGAELDPDPPDPATSLWGSDTTPEGFYTLSLPTLTADTYTIRATATGTQTADAACATIELKHTGERTPAECW